MFFQNYFLMQAMGFMTAAFVRCAKRSVVSVWSTVQSVSCTLGLIKRAAGESFFGLVRFEDFRDGRVLGGAACQRKRNHYCQNSKPEDGHYFGKDAIFGAYVIQASFRHGCVQAYAR